MPKKANIWVSPHPDGWQTQKEGSERASGVFTTQEKAIDSAVSQAKKEHVEVIIQGENGKIRSKDSYGNDPNPPKDTEH